MAYIAGDPRLLRPINYPAAQPGRGFGIYRLADGRGVLVANAMARLFMDAIDDPFAAIGRLFFLDEHPARRPRQAMPIVDFHGEGDVGEECNGAFLRRPRLGGGRHT